MKTTVTKIIEWDAGHRVPNHKSKCHNLHGHRYKMELTLSGPLIDISGDSSEGMVFDFGDIKKVMTEKVHDVLDHGFIWYDKDPVMINVVVLSKGMKYILVNFIPTAENLAKWCYEQMVNYVVCVQQWRENLKVIIMVGLLIEF